jgi:phosphatidate cytidylyltransferase
LTDAVGLAVVVSIFAPLGDLAESALKRDMGVKDMGSILPGHGGVLDRFDSILFVAPAAFYFLRLIR